MVNALLGMAVYGNDRSTVRLLSGASPAQLAALGSAAFYASRPETLPLAPLVLVLHTATARRSRSVRWLLVVGLPDRRGVLPPAWHAGRAGGRRRLTRRPSS